MNLEYVEGSFVTLVDFTDSGLSKKPGLMVHVERHNGSLVELTLKMLERNGEGWILMPRSSNPRHQPLKLNGDEGTSIIIRGVVTGTYRRVEI